MKIARPALAALSLASCVCNAAVPVPPITVSGNAPHSAAIGINYGAISSPSTKSTIYVTTNNITSSNTEGEAWARAQRIMLQITNPTSIALTNVQWQVWLGEHEPYLTITLKNTSHMPALKITSTILDPSSGKTYASLKPYRFLKVSRTVQAIGNSLSIDGQGETSEPLLAMSDVIKIYPGIAEDYPHACVFGATLNPNDLSSPLSGDYGAQTANVPFLASIRYENAFGETTKQTQLIYAKILLAWRENTLPVDGAQTPQSICDPTRPQSSNTAGSSPG